MKITVQPNQNEKLLKALGKLITKDKISGDGLSSEDSQVLGAFVDQWKPGLIIEKGDVYLHAGVIYKALVDQTTEPGSEPDSSPSLWSTKKKVK